MNYFEQKKEINRLFQEALKEFDYLETRQEIEAETSIKEKNGKAVIACKIEDCYKGYKLRDLSEKLIVFDKIFVEKQAKKTMKENIAPNVEKNNFSFGIVFKKNSFFERNFYVELFKEAVQKENLIKKIVEEIIQQDIFKNGINPDYKQILNMIDIYSDINFKEDQEENMIKSIEIDFILLIKDNCEIVNGKYEFENLDSKKVLKRLLKNTDFIFNLYQKYIYPIREKFIEKMFNEIQRMLKNEKALFEINLVDNTVSEKNSFATLKFYMDGFIKVYAPENDSTSIFNEKNKTLFISYKNITQKLLTNFLKKEKNNLIYHNLYKELFYYLLNLFIDFYTQKKRFELMQQIRLLTEMDNAREKLGHLKGKYND